MAEVGLVARTLVPGPGNPSDKITRDQIERADAPSINPSIPSSR
jgi:hypothetical protein